MGQQKLIVRTATLVTGAGTPAQLDAAAEIVQVDVGDLMNISLFIVQVTDAGTVTLTPEESPDGIAWAPVGATISEAGFRASNNDAVKRSLSDANGMSLPTAFVRLVATALAGGGVYKLIAIGWQRDGYK